MADEPVNQQSITDDQELAKVLAGVTQQADEAAASTPDPATPPAVPTQDDSAETPDLQMPTLDPIAPTSSVEETPEVSPVLEPQAPQESPSSMASSTPSSNPELDSIKLEALNELRPLVDKLDVSPEERFDTYLLLLRSTDDKELIAPAHDAAKNISDEARRAQALLDIIKEIDFLNQTAK
jgi:hypothetical protein